MEEKDLLIKNIEINYLKPIFGFAMKRTYSEEEAEELASEIVYQIILTIHRIEEIKHFEGFVWGVAQNTYKKWVLKQKRKRDREIVKEEHVNCYEASFFKNNIEDHTEHRVALDTLKRELSLLSRTYREVMVGHYIEGLNCKELAIKLNISDQMIKFYLSKGREKIKEGMQMWREYGEKSYNPSSFSVYIIGTWNAEEDLWEVLRKKLPCNIVLAAYENPISIPDLSIETGVPTVFLEEEVEKLVELELMREITKGKYQTNFFIAKRGVLEQFKEIVSKQAKGLATFIEEHYEGIESQLLEVPIFAYPVLEGRYQHFYLQKIVCEMLMRVSDNLVYTPCEASFLHDAFIGGTEDTYLRWGFGISPLMKEDYLAQRCDINYDYSGVGKGPDTKQLSKLRQRQFSVDKIEALIDIYKNGISEQDLTSTLELAQQGYLVKYEDRYYPNIPIISKEVDEMLTRLMQESIDKLLLTVHETVQIGFRVFKKVTPKHIRENLMGYLYMISIVYITNDLFEELHQAGYIEIPDIENYNQITSYIVLK